MTQQKRKREKPLVSPKGIFVYPHLNKPDSGWEDKMADDPEFNVKLRLNAAESEKLKAVLAPVVEQAITKGKEKFKKLKPAAREKLGDITVNQPGEAEYDDQDEPTGDVSYRFKTKAYYTDDNTGERTLKVLPMFDHNGDPIKERPIVYGGTIGRVSFRAVPYFIPKDAAVGVSLYLVGTQIVNLQTNIGADAGYYGFEADEDGEEIPESNTSGFPTDDEGDTVEDSVEEVDIEEDDDEGDF